MDLDLTPRTLLCTIHHYSSASATSSTRATRFSLAPSRRLRVLWVRTVLLLVVKYE